MRRGRVRRSWCVLLAVLAGTSWGAPLPVDAMVVLPATFSEMVATSPLIVHGRVVEVRGQTTSDRRGIESVVTLLVVESLKGHPGQMVVLRVPGGQVGRYRRVMVGAPEFGEGDEVIVFLSGQGPAVPMPFGVSQGVYRVTRDRDRQTVVSQALLDGPSSGAGERLLRGDPARRPLAIAEFTQRVKAMVEAGR
jgi:hypothetical protein